MNIQISAEELAKKKLFLGTPMYGGVCIGLYAKSCMDLSVLCKHYGIELKFYALFNESLITRARNYICDEFMRSQFGHLLFIDADIGFDPNDIIAMMAMQTDDSPYDIIGGPYPKKNISWEKVVTAVNKGMADENPNNLDQFVGDFVFNPKQGTTHIPLGEPCEVLEIGTGFMMIRRKTFEAFDKAFPEYLYRPDHVRTEHFDGSRQIMQYFQAEIDAVNSHKFFTNELNTLFNSDNVTAKDIETVLKKYQDENAKKSNRYLSEDYWFCQKMQELGLKTFLCPWMKTTHTGTMVYGGSLAALAQISASPTADPSALKKQKKI